MFEEVLGSLQFSDKFEGEEADFGSLRHKAVLFSNSNFKAIPNTSSGTIAFIDGGNSELLKSPSFSLQLCRIGYCIFSKNKRIKHETKDFYVVASVVHNKFVTKTFGTDMQFTFDVDDEHFKTGKSRGTPSSVVSAIRRFAELQLASTLDADVIVLDGSLQQTYPFEDEFLKRLQHKSIVGFCKTSSLLTKSGNSVLALMNLHKGRFIYYPVANMLDETYKADICFVRLHDRSTHVFKVDFSNKVDECTIALLAQNACDPAFLGYPYGLVLVDRLVRISNHEAQYVRTKLLSKIKNKNMLNYLNALNAHDVLDSI
jgi:hypothetical protein